MKNQILWSDYPRPQMKRDKYMILNGEWDLNGHPVTVPFAPQSELSGYKGELLEKLYYKKTFSIPHTFNDERIILHFGAVDQIADVKINGSYIGHNEGGYIPFCFDITDYINRTSDNTLEVIVTDDLCSDYPYGKQTKTPKGMWYTQVSGIWQTVWIENVPDIYIKHLTMETTLNSLSLKISCNKNATNFSIFISLPDNKIIERTFDTDQITIPIPEPIHWSPKTPYLYSMKIVANTDTVESYFALRTIEIQKINGINRICLNNKPLFMHGVLDQGYFCDGIFLPEQPSSYDNDIIIMKELGFNTLRKHIKIEPEQFYYACDRLGMLVIQDMVNSGNYSFLRDTVLPTIGFKKKRDVFLAKNDKRRTIFEEQMKLTVSHLYNHPCIIAYTIFNEGWGQFNSDEMYDLLKSMDNTRLADTTSGWFAQHKSDFLSEHIYFRTPKLKKSQSPLLVSECGGFKYFIKEHFFGKNQYGYGSCKDSDDLTGRIKNMYEKMIIPGISIGVCGCIYTQVSDVEDEINGLYTYDRKICKVDKEQMNQIAIKIENEIEHIYQSNKNEKSL